MEKKALKYFMLLGLILFLAGNAIAQDVDQVGDPISSQDWVAYIDSNHPSISWSLNTPVAAGYPVQQVSNSDLFLKTSVFQGTGWLWDRVLLGSIQAEISSGMPPGMSLMAISAPCTTTNSGGHLGNPRGQLTLTTRYQNLVTQIGTSYTGTDPLDGYQITFTLTPSNYGQIQAGTYNVGVAFYITP